MLLTWLVLHELYHSIYERLLIGFAGLEKLLSYGHSSQIFGLVTSALISVLPSHSILCLVLDGNFCNKVILMLWFVRAPSLVLPSFCYIFLFFLMLPLIVISLLTTLLSFLNVTGVLSMVTARGGF